MRLSAFPAISRTSGGGVLASSITTTRPFRMPSRIEEVDRSRAHTRTLAEPMGAETFLHLQTGATAFVARVPPAGRYAADDQIDVAFDLSHAHLFDPATGQVLT